MTEKEAWNSLISKVNVSYYIGKPAFTILNRKFNAPDTVKKVVSPAKKTAKVEGSESK